MNNCSKKQIKLNKECEFIDFEYRNNTNFVKGKVYSFINENNEIEKGECLSYDEYSNILKLKKI